MHCPGMASFAACTDSPTLVFSYPYIPDYFFPILPAIVDPAVKSVIVCVCVCLCEFCVTSLSTNVPVISQLCLLLSSARVLSDDYSNPLCRPVTYS